MREAEMRKLLDELAADASARLAAIDADLDELRADRRGDQADDEHDPEGATLSAEWSRLAGLRDEIAREQRDIEAAFSRWEAGEFGVCQDCGKPIPVGRLRARPTATRCVSCAERAGG